MFARFLDILKKRDKNNNVYYFLYLRHFLPINEILLFIFHVSCVSSYDSETVLFKLNAYMRKIFAKRTVQHNATSYMYIYEA